MLQFSFAVESLLKADCQPRNMQLLPNRCWVDSITWAQYSDCGGGFSCPSPGGTVWLAGWPWGRAMLFFCLPVTGKVQHSMAGFISNKEV